ncbi:MAG TPA: diguanylate cyclase [Pseudobdellovibrionaceae bacterium]|jgi:diguanylate cyclase (GGDEF)-like protein
MVRDNLVKSPKERKILVIDDDADSREIILEPLRWEHFDARGVSSGIEALKLMETWVPNIIILDWMIPGISGLQILQTLRAHYPHVSCIFISGNSSTESIIEALDSGSDDYIIKPFVPLELLARIRTHFRIRDLHSQLLLANERLKELVDTDDLTGLFNMRSFYQRLDFELERGKRFGRDVCVVMMDMDYFKTVNDGHDHLFGSYVLSEVGKVIRINTRNIDIPARYGGDEFLVVLMEVDYRGAMHFCERLRNAIAERTFVSGNDSINLTLSLGFAITVQGEDISARELVRRADHALYEAKYAGRNQTRFYTAETDKVRELRPKPVPPTKKPAAG